MQSMAFIKAAGELINKIEQSPGGSDDTVQREISQLFSGLQNPTLPSAFRLRDTAQANGYTVDGRVLQRLAQFDNLSS